MYKDKNVIIILQQQCRTHPDERTFQGMMPERLKRDGSTPKGQTIITPKMTTRLEDITSLENEQGIG